MATIFNIYSGQFEDVPIREEAAQRPYLLFGIGEPINEISDFYFDIKNFAVYRWLDDGWELQGKIEIPEIPKMPDIPKVDVKAEALPLIRQELHSALNALPRPKEGITEHDVASMLHMAIGSLDYATPQQVQDAVSSIKTPKPRVIVKEAKQIELRRNATHIQWRREGEEWQDLFAIPKSSGGGSGAALRELRDNYYTKVEIDAFLAQLVGGTPL